MNKTPQRFKERTPIHKAVTWAQGEVGQLEGARTLYIPLAHLKDGESEAERG